MTKNGLYKLVYLSASSQCVVGHEEVAIWPHLLDPVRRFKNALQEQSIFETLAALVQFVNG